jgi:hypothetical protein
MLRRLLRMPIGEVADRSRQEASKWLERRGLARAEPMPSAPPRLEVFQELAPLRFFAGASDERVPALFAELEPTARERVVAAAEDVCLGRFDLLGYKALWFGDPIDWRLDPVSGRRAPDVHWSLIDALDPALGDSKVIWELGRQQYLVTLGVAYRSSGDERYARAFVQLVQAFLRENPAGWGMQWASALEVSLRLIAWCWALLLFRRSAALTPGVFGEIAAGIAQHAAHVERYLSRHFSPNTHLTGEALGLFYAGVLFPERKAASRWRELGLATLERQIERQVLADGVYFEQSTGYQRYTIEIYLHLLLLAARNGLRLPESLGEAVQRMLDVLLALRRPGGALPVIGDDDGGCLLPLVPREPGDVRGLFGTAAALFERPDYAWAAGGVASEALWLLGRGALERTRALPAAPPPHTSRAFTAGGYVVMRSSWHRDAHQLVLDAGPLGCPLSGAHGHADLLAVQVCAFGEPYVVDPGTAVYAAEPALREQFRGSAVHATAQVDDLPQAEPAGPFAWRQRPRARLRSFRSTLEFDFADAEHKAYRRLADPVTHRRRVVFVKSPGYFLIVDDFRGECPHRIELRFPFAPLQVRAEESGWVRAAAGDGRGLLLRALAGVPLETRIERSWIAPRYGCRESAPLVAFRTEARLPLRVSTLLIPVESAEAAAPSVQPWLDRALVIAGIER